jgi:integrase
MANFRKEQYRTGEHSLTTKQVTILLENTEDFTEYVFLKVAISTGIRRSDVVRLKWKDINFEDNKISFVEKKKGNSPHEVYVSQSIMSDLKRLKSIQDNEYYIFPGKSEEKYGKGHISSRTAYNILQRNLEVAKLPARPFHALRATCIKLCEAKGWSEQQTAKHVNDSVRVIQEHYKTPSLEERRSIALEKELI